MLLTPALLRAQRDTAVVSPTPSLETRLRFPTKDSIRYFAPGIIRERAHMRNMHVENAAVRYAVATLKNNPMEYRELYRYIRVLTNYIENRSIRRMVSYMRNYFKTVPAKEEAIRKLKEEIRQDSLYLLSQYPGADTLHYETVDENLSRIVYYMEHDEVYQWLREKSRDSVLLTLLTANNKQRKVWLNDGKAKFFHFSANNFLGDTIGTWMQVFPKGYKIRLFLDENVFQIRKYVDPQEYTYEEIIPRPDSLYKSLAHMHIGHLDMRHWWYYTDVAISFGQGYISDSWASGGESSLSILSDLKFFVNYKKNSLTWENSFRYRLGALKNGSEAISKNEDKFEIQSKIGLKAFRHWNYASQFDMNTVLFKGYSSPDRSEQIAEFLAPAYFTLSLGLDFKPKSNISLYLSPIAGQWIYMRDTTGMDPTRYGIEAGKKSKSDAGAKVELKNNHDLWDFLKVDNRVILFSSYYDNPEYITIDWQVTLNFKINYFLQTSVYMNAVYDKHNSKKIQFKETLGLGINFRF